MTVLMGLDARLRAARLYLVVDAATDRRPFGDLLGAAFAGGIDVVGVRPGGRSDRDVLTCLELAREIALRHRGLVAVHDDVAVAKRFGADVLHLGSSEPVDGATVPVRRSLHQWARVGRSADSPGGLAAALRRTDTDHLWVGPVFRRAVVGSDPGAGLGLVRRAAELAPVADCHGKPWFAVGGINETNVDEVIAAGARRVAVSAAIVAAREPRAAAEMLSDRLAAAWRADDSLRDLAFGALPSSPPLAFPPPDADA